MGDRMARRNSKKSRRSSKNRPLPLSRSRPAGETRPRGDAAEARPGAPSRPGGEAGTPAGAPLPVRWLWARWRWIAWGLALGAVVFLYLVVKAFSLHPYVGDEYIYLYQSKLVSEWVAPYSAFAAAHPPLQMVFTAVLFKVFGFNFIMVRLLPVLWYLAGGVLIAWTVRRELGGVASVTAAALFLLSYEPLRASSHYTGVNMTTALLVGAVLAYRYRAVRAAALVSVCAVFTRLYAIPGVAVLVLYALIADRREGVRLVMWGGLFGTCAFVVAGVFTGFGDMVQNLLVYHAQKTPMNPEELAGMKDTVLFHNATPILLFCLSLPALAAVLVRAHDRLDAKLGIFRRLEAAVSETRTGLVLLCLLIALTYAVMLLAMDRVWMYYFVPPIAFSAVVSGWLAAVIARGTGRLLTSRGSLLAAGIPKRAALGGVVIVALFVLGFLLSPRLESRLGYWDKRMDRAPEDRGKTYHFQPTVLPGIVEAWARFLLWHDERIIGQPYNTFNYVLWHESRVFDVADEIVETIRDETSAKGEIFGDSGTVPLFALLSGRRIAGNEVDTNSQRYKSGSADPKELISKIDNPRTEMIILRYRFGVAGVLEVRHLVEAKYRRVKTVRSAQGRVFLLYRRRPDVDKG
jgi:hypothetical protein